MRGKKKKGHMYDTTCDGFLHYFVSAGMMFWTYWFQIFDDMIQDGICCSSLHGCLYLLAIGSGIGLGEVGICASAIACPWIWRLLVALLKVQGL